MVSGRGDFEGLFSLILAYDIAQARLGGWRLIANPFELLLDRKSVV